jgi:hypothetical protein
MSSQGYWVCVCEREREREGSDCCCLEMEQLDDETYARLTIRNTYIHGRFPFNRSIAFSTVAQAQPTDDQRTEWEKYDAER